MKDNVKTFSQSYDLLKRLCFACIIGFCVSNLVWIAVCYQLNKIADRKVYVVSDTGTIWATSQDNVNTFNQYEARNFMKVFCKLMFAHDASTYKSNMDHALPLIHRDFGGPIKADYDNSKLYQTYVNYDASTSIDIDSVSINMNTRPLTGAVYMHHITHYGKYQSTSPLAYRFTLDRVSRSDQNPYGLFITSLERLQYNPTEAKVDPYQAEEKAMQDKKVIDSLVNGAQSTK